MALKKDLVIFKLKLFLKICFYVCFAYMYRCMLHVCLMLWMSEENLGSPELELQMAVNNPWALVTEQWPSVRKTSALNH